MAAPPPLQDGLTLRLAQPLTEPSVALITALPADMPMACPPGAIVATDGLLLPQVTLFVTSVVLPSEYVATAWKCFVRLVCIEALDGVTLMDRTPWGPKWAVTFLFESMVTTVDMLVPEASPPQ
jgi:hypothetical protein